MNLNWEWNRVLVCWILLLVFVNSLTAMIQARGHLVADLDPLGITYADLHGTYTDRKGAPPEQVVRHYMLGKAACGDVGHATYQ